MSIDWKDEATKARLTALVREGHTATAIAAIFNRELGVEVSRNAVLGAIHRQKLGDSRPPRQPVGRVQRVRSASALGNRIAEARARAGRAKAQPRNMDNGLYASSSKREDRSGTVEAHVAKAAKAAKLKPEPPLNLTLEQLTDATCKWAINDGSGEAGFLFCGHPQWGGDGTKLPLPYCEAHSRMAVSRFQPEEEQ